MPGKWSFTCAGWRSTSSNHMRSVWSDPKSFRKPELQGHSAPVPENDCPDPWAGSGGRCARTSIFPCEEKPRSQLRDLGHPLIVRRSQL
jgi:hypothetical protein